MVVAHVAGLPVEETIAQLAPVGVALLVGLRMTSERFRRFARRRGKRTADPDGG